MALDSADSVLLPDRAPFAGRRGRQLPPVEAASLGWIVGSSLVCGQPTL